jgi:hypothetical protein
MPSYYYYYVCVCVCVYALIQQLLQYITYPHVRALEH